MFHVPQFCSIRCFSKYDDSEKIDLLTSCDETDKQYVQ